MNKESTYLPVQITAKPFSLNYLFVLIKVGSRFLGSSDIISFKKINLRSENSVILPHVFFILIFYFSNYEHLRR